MKIWTWPRLKLLIQLIILAAVVCVARWNVPHRESVSWSGPAVEYDLEDAGYQVDHTAVIDGKHSFRRNGTETFEGPFLISALELGKRSRITFAGGVGEPLFYDENGQPILAQVFQVVPVPDSQAAVVRLYDQYAAEGGEAQASFTGQRFLCLGELTRQEAIAFLDSLKN